MMDAANLDDGSGGGRLADLRAYDAFVAANTALTNNADGRQGRRRASTSAAAVKVILDKVTGNTPARFRPPGTVTQRWNAAILPYRRQERRDTTVTATNRLGNGEVYDVTVGVADDAGNSSEQTIEVVQATVFASGFAAIMDALATATEDVSSPMPASPSIAMAKNAANMLAGINLASVPDKDALKALIGDVDGALAINGTDQTTVTGFTDGGLWAALQAFINAADAAARTMSICRMSG